MAAFNYLAVGQGFVEHYYNCFDFNKPALVNLYVNESMLTFEGQQCCGQEAIMKKITELPFKTIKHIVTSHDTQPIVGVDGGEAVFILVMGQLKTDDDPPHSFVQSFILRKTPGGYVIANDEFRMVLHNG